MELSIKRKKTMSGPFTRNLDKLDPVAMTIAKNIMERRKQALAAMPDQLDEKAVHPFFPKIPLSKLQGKKKVKKEETEQLDELSKEKLGSYRAKASGSHTDAVLSADKKKLSKRTIGLGRAKALLRHEEIKEKVDAEIVEELINEASRKHFRMVADLLKNIPDAGKRKEMAHQHAQIFSQQNPRFDHQKFMQAAGVSTK
jgi:hypothetical protein